MALCLSGVAAVLTRYEGAFAVAVASMILLHHRRIRLAAIFVLLSAMPILLYSAYGLSKGALVLPNSILIKTNGTKWWHPFPSISWPSAYPRFILEQGGIFLALFLAALCIDRFSRCKLFGTLALRQLFYFAAGAFASLAGWIWPLLRCRKVGVTQPLQTVNAMRSARGYVIVRASENELSRSRRKRPFMSG